MFIISHQLPRKRKMQSMCFNALKRNALITKYIQSCKHKKILNTAQQCIRNWKWYSETEKQIKSMQYLITVKLKKDAFLELRSLENEKLAKIEKEYTTRKYNLKVLLALKKYKEKKIHTKLQHHQDKCNKLHNIALAKRVFMNWRRHGLNIKRYYANATHIIINRCTMFNKREVINWLRIVSANHEKIMPIVSIPLLNSFKWIRMYTSQQKNARRLHCNAISVMQAMRCKNTLMALTHYNRSKAIRRKANANRDSILKMQAIKYWKMHILLSNTKNERANEAHNYYLIKLKRKAIKRLQRITAHCNYAQKCIANRTTYYCCKSVIRAIKNINHNPPIENADLHQTNTKTPCKSEAHNTKDEEITKTIINNHSLSLKRSVIEHIKKLSKRPTNILPQASNVKPKYALSVLCSLSNKQSALPSHSLITPSSSYDVSRHLVYHGKIEDANDLQSEVEKRLRILENEMSSIK